MQTEMRREEGILFTRRPSSRVAEGRYVRSFTCAACDATVSLECPQVLRFHLPEEVTCPVCRVWGEER